MINNKNPIEQPGAATETDERFLPSLALALVDHPRATLQELAKAIGVSKATLYRFCRTREQLIDRLMTHGSTLVRQSYLNAQTENGTALEALRRLIVNHLDHKEMTIFLIYHWRPEFLDESHPDRTWLDSQDAFDALFLRGQREGLFRIDISAAAMTEICFSIMLGLIEAERRGRVARAGLAQLIEQALTNGICASNAISA